MPLDEIWNLVHHPDSLTPVWAERRFDSPLATVPGPVDINGTLTDAQSSATLRIRHTDVSLAGKSMTRAGDARVWTIGETLEVGRRQWIDMGIATYPTPTTIVPDPTPGPDPEPTPVGYVPPVGWNVVFDGAPLRTLTIASVQTQAGGRRSGTFEAVSGATGGMTSALDIASDRWMLGSVTRTGRYMYWSWLTGSAYTAEWDYSYVMRANAGLDYDYPAGTYPAESDTETPTSHPLFVGDEVRLATDAEWQEFFK